MKYLIKGCKKSQVFNMKASKPNPKVRLFMQTLISFFIFIMCNCLSAQTDTTVYDKDFELIMAAYKNNAPYLKTLINDDANVNATTYDNISALMYACNEGHFEIVRILVENGADVNFNPRRNNPPLISAVLGNYPEIVEYLLINNANPNIRGIYGFSPLIWAAAYDLQNQAELLLKYNANVNFESLSNETALWYAAYFGYYNMMNLLLKYGANPNQQNYQGFSPIMLAAELNDTVIYNVLAFYDIDYELRTTAGDNAVLLAVRNSSTEMLELLLSNVNLTNYDSKQISKIAYVRRDKSSIELLKNKKLKIAKFPVIKGISLICGTNASGNNLVFNTGLIIPEHKHKLMIAINWNSSYWYKRIEIENNNSIYQYWNKPHFLSLGLYKSLYYTETNMNFYIGARNYYIFDKYRGVENKPKVYSTISPVIGCIKTNKLLGYGIDYSFLKLNTKSISPHRLSLFMTFNFGQKINTKYKSKCRIC